jgi:hypothetical protein
LKVGEILSGHSNREFVLETPRPVDVQAIVARRLYRLAGELSADRQPQPRAAAGVARLSAPCLSAATWIATLPDSVSFTALPAPGAGHEDTR